MIMIYNYIDIIYYTICYINLDIDINILTLFLRRRMKMIKTIFPWLQKINYNYPL